MGTLEDKRIWFNCNIGEMATTKGGGSSRSASLTASRSTTDTTITASIRFSRMSTDAMLRKPCEIVTQNPEYPTHTVYDGDLAIALLNKYPPLYDHMLITP
jgi:hypothetical protein